jgi:hypothetical protein
MNKRTISWTLDSKHAQEYPSLLSSRFRTNLGEIIYVKKDERIFVTPRYAEIPNTYLQISAHLANNTFTVTGAGLNEQITIPNGSYFGNNLAAIIEYAINYNAAVQAALGGANVLTVTYNANSNVLQFSLTGSQIPIGLTISANGFGEMIGLPSRVLPYPITNAIPLLSAEQADCIPDTTIALSTSLNTINNSSSRVGGRTNILEYFTRGATGTRSTYSASTTDFRTELKLDQISNIELALSDTSNRDLDLDGKHWKITLLFEIERDELI